MSMVATMGMPVPDVLGSVAMAMGTAEFLVEIIISAYDGGHGSARAGHHDPHVWLPAAPRPPRSAVPPPPGGALRPLAIKLTRKIETVTGFDT